VGAVLEQLLSLDNSAKEINDGILYVGMKRKHGKAVVDNVSAALPFLSICCPTLMIPTSATLSVLSTSSAHSLQNKHSGAHKQASKDGHTNLWVLVVGL
jgi:hypothetical protein